MIVLTFINTSLIIVILFYLFKIRDIDKRFDKELIGWLSSQEKINYEQLRLSELLNEKIKMLMEKNNG